MSVIIVAVGATRAKVQSVIWPEMAVALDTMRAQSD